MSEENESSIDFDTIFDEAAIGRMSHAEFLHTIRQWALEASLIITPFGHIARLMQSEDATKDDLEKASQMFPVGVGLLFDKFNELYDSVQVESVKVFGEPYDFGSDHTEACDGTKKECGHVDHWKQ
jgi:hypothetical protein